MCTLFYQVNTGTIPGFTTVIPTWYKYDKIGILKIDGTLRHCDHPDISPFQKNKCAKHFQISNKLTNIMGGYLVVYKV